MITTKVGAMESIAASGMLLPDLIIRGLAAADRLKYYLTLLQSAYLNGLAENPGSVSNHHREREANGIADVTLDRMIESSVARGNDTVYIPGVSPLIASMFEETQQMMRPLLVAAVPQSELSIRTEVYQRRLKELSSHVPLCADDVVTRSAMDVLTRLTKNGHDTLHQVMTDLKWELNRLQSTIALEMIDGARVYSIGQEERTLVRAFMKGINQTSHVTFDDPSPVTTAARDGDQLRIDTDLGGVPPLSIAVRIKGTTATLTYTDPHASRIRFLQDLLAHQDIRWTHSAPEDGQGTVTGVISGEWSADSVERLEEGLTDVASRLVFLVDWHKARKALSQLVGKTDALQLLKWAAEHNIGHVAFLKCGDIALIEEAVERAVSFDVKPAARLDRWLGAAAARAYLMWVLRITSTALAAGRSMRFIQDEVEAELLRYLHTRDQRVLADAAEHASLVSALDAHVVQTLTHLKNGDGRAEEPGVVERAAANGRQADARFRLAERRPRQGDGDHGLHGLVAEADSAVAALEETSFLLTLLQDSCDPKIVSMLGTLAHLVQGAVHEYMDCLEDGRDLSPASLHGDVESFLLAVDRLVAIGHQAHLTKRALTEKLVRGGPGDMRQLFVVTNLARELERAASALSRCGPIVRDHILHSRLSGQRAPS